MSRTDCNGDLSLSCTQAEKQKNDLLKELEELKDKIEETGGVAMAQTELSKKREAELQKMQADARTQAEEHDRTVADLRKKHQASVNELQEQVHFFISLSYALIRLLSYMHEMGGYMA